MKDLILILKWLGFMIPGFAAQAVLVYFFNYQTHSSPFSGLAIFSVLSLGNLVAYHLFLVPQKIKKQLGALLVGPRYISVADINMDTLGEIIEYYKLRQFTYDGRTKAELLAFQQKASRASTNYKLAEKCSNWLLYAFLAGVFFYNILTPAYGIGVIYSEWAVGLLLVISTPVIKKRRRFWWQEGIALKRCIEKCGDDQVFRYDDEL
ncbi:hypothetical protein J2T17_004331 [Paenibacillus mucilaginosus]|uniref:hypothetical protein n=1 Tax=Paenibacillus mucilaginosus TaxID=61624 RepID=UPI003D1F04CB